MVILRAEEVTSSSIGHRYQVFLSFRGKDTRKNFTDHLYTALVQAGIHTFKDEHELERGKNIANELHRAIQESKIALIVFSRNYASSEWCLNELAGILERMKTSGLTVIPVFYDVQPSDVRYQGGSFGEAFSVHEEVKFKSMEMVDNIEKWREALREVANLGGMVLQNEADGYESKFIEEIIQHIKIKLNPTPYWSPNQNQYRNPNPNWIQHVESMQSRMASDFSRFSRGFDSLVGRHFLPLFLFFLFLILLNWSFDDARDALDAVDAVDGDDISTWQIWRTGRSGW